MLPAYIIRTFWDKSGLSPCEEFYEIDEHRCEVCAKVYKRAQDLKTHKTKKKHHYHKMPKVSGLAKKEAIKIKNEKAQGQLPAVKWGEEPVANCWAFEYLGAIFTPDGGQMTDVRRRIAMAQQRHGKMRHIWKSGHLHLRLKMRLYVAAVCSVMCYGTEAWTLDKKTKSALNGANSKMVSAITGRTIHDEAKSDGKTYDVVAGIRATRLRWLGQILRMKEDRMVHKTVKMMYEDRRDGDLLMDAPKAVSWEELKKMAAAEKGKLWQQLVRQIKDVVCIEATKGGG